MDVEITKLNGESFRLSEKDIQAQDFIVSSIEILPSYGTIEGRSGMVDYGADYGSRTISIPFYLRARDMHDYPLLRDELFSLVTTKESFYIRELRRPSEFTTCDDGYDDRYVGGKRYLVRLSNVIDLDQQRTYGFGELEFETTELPFAESIGTSADIDNPELIPLIPELWAQGYWVNVIGGNGTATLSTTVRLKERFSVRGDTSYIVKNDSTNTSLIFSMYNETGYKRRISIPPNEEVEIITDSDINLVGVHFSTVPNDGTDISTSDIKNKLKGSIKKKTSGINTDDGLWGFGMGLISDDDSLIYTHIETSFKIFNPGIKVHPFEQDLEIEISDVLGSTSYLQLENQTTGDTFRVTESVNDSQLIKLDGPNITSNNLQYLRKTNRKYITLAPGWNNFRITGATSAKVSFDTRFYYL